MFLESCHDSIKYTEADLKKAIEGDHIRLVFAAPRKATVLDDELSITEIAFTLPIGRGVFWLRGVSATLRPEGSRLDAPYTVAL